VKDLERRSGSNFTLDKIGYQEFKLSKRGRGVVTFYIIWRNFFGIIWRIMVYNLLALGVTF
jgi:hypothetical protein